MLFGLVDGKLINDHPTHRLPFETKMGMSGSSNCSGLQAASLAAFRGDPQNCTAPLCYIWCAALDSVFDLCVNP
jgi:hypothetical protein